MARDLNTLRTTLLGELGVRFILSMTLERSGKVNGLMPMGISSLNAAVSCFACGLSSEGFALAKHAQGFLTASLEANEIPNHYFRGVSEAQRLIYLSMASALNPESDFVPPPSSAVEYLAQACRDGVEGYYLLYIICGANEQVLNVKKLKSANPRSIRHPDKFAYYLAESAYGQANEEIVSAFLTRYARICLGLVRGLGTPVDFLAAMHAAYGNADHSSRIAAICSNPTNA